MNNGFNRCAKLRAKCRLAISTDGNMAELEQVGGN
jgi:hypothetical protein